ncbi:MAG TPA: MnhB domain-containing protein [Mycobacteriales bacterium]|nr:MnhB domain-containing protein [Mycobacteriales bacterium]
MTPPGELADTEPLHRPRIGVVLVLALAALIAVACIDLPREGAALSSVAHQALSAAQPHWHTTEPVNEVVYGTRGFDTFGETFLLLAAVMSVVVLARRKEPRHGFIGEELEGRQERPSAARRARGDQGDTAMARSADAGEEGLDNLDRPETPDEEPVGLVRQELAQGMTVVTRSAARTAAPVLAVAGVYLCAWNYTPGGGFPAGAVILGVVLLAYAGYGYPRIAAVVRPAVMELVELGGAMLIVALEVLGLVFKGSVSENWLPMAPVETIRAGGVMQAFSASELIEVATGLTIAVFTILAIRHDWTVDEQ